MVRSENLIYHFQQRATNRGDKTKGKGLMLMLLGKWQMTGDGYMGDASGRQGLSP